MTVSNPNPCYNEVCYKRTALSLNIAAAHFVMQ